jgi:hypothetical protein
MSATYDRRRRGLIATNDLHMRILVGPVMEIHRVDDHLVVTRCALVSRQRDQEGDVLAGLALRIDNDLRFV